MREVRIEKAAELLKFSDRSISEFSQDCGFFDSSHFFRVFAESKGCFPTHFRKGRDEDLLS